MSQPPEDQPPLKSKITAEERRARDADRLVVIRLRMAITRTLEDRGITTPVAVAEALGMTPAEAARLMNGKIWRPGEVAELQAAAARLGVEAPS